MKGGQKMIQGRIGKSGFKMYYKKTFKLVRISNSVCVLKLIFFPPVECRYGELAQMVQRSLSM